MTEAQVAHARLVCDVTRPAPGLEQLDAAETPQPRERATFGLVVGPGRSCATPLSAGLPDGDMQVVDYEVVEGRDLGDLKIKVLKMIELGWQPKGGVSSKATVRAIYGYQQAMVKVQPWGYTEPDVHSD